MWEHEAGMVVTECFGEYLKGSRQPSGHSSEILVPPWVINQFVLDSIAVAWRWEFSGKTVDIPPESQGDPPIDRRGTKHGG